MIRRLAGVLIGIGLTLSSTPVMALITSVGARGIDAYRLQDAPYHLTGRKIAIGQVEIGRPALFGLDKAAVNNRSLQVGRLFYQGSVATANDGIDDHAARVASIMVSRDKTVLGVAPNAVLYASGVGTSQRSGQVQECQAAQTVALQNGGDVRAINFSFGESLSRDPRLHAVLDGNALLTQCVDWSARVHNVLYAISGNQGRGGYPIPTDTFNGMTIANSMPINGNFTKVDFFSLGSQPKTVIGRDPATERNVGARRSVTVVAPGRRIETLGTDGELVPGDLGGTSFASPHVTATVALLQEWGDQSIRQVQGQQVQGQARSVERSHWGLDARRQEVMKAVLMNAADKVEDSGDGLRLGMSRTLLNLNNQSWIESDAYQTLAIPLDAEMGTGHLNAYRAYQQFSPGQWSDAQAIPAIAWDYNTLGENVPGEAEVTSAYRDYVFERPLQAGSFVAATLVWNRLVDLNDLNGNEEFDLGETFINKGLNNLDLYLMPAIATQTQDSIWSSVSQVDSVEHIFHPVPTTGRYKLRVVYRDRVNEPTQPYALAWWTP
ncbi:MAG: S8 family serine peptidase [Leptolyngbyaceae cyanobacterium CRU_2_3]|nr:S8 family serine peptidase [Leptolyngbyaceae cyanobacterium CRU_2_3]